ncbi:type IV pilus assembly protein FimV [Spiribacter insolitus]|uniref:FimV/HubP family polar landmark protein n=1 Tax=Spiribacter insolitus TaxID=3122417 RepID=A0ABV3T4C2_9GAMM
MRRGIALACLLLVAVPSARALQLGDLRIQSQSGEPLAADIAVAEADRIDTASATVELASDRAHAEAGINPQTLPPSLSLELAGAEPARIRLSTRAPFEVAGDGLEFLVVLSWPDGRLVRQYGIDGDGKKLQPSSGSDLRYGPTRATDTLYSIAETVRPEAVATNQMMLALLAENPGSFNAENINALQRDTTLRIPPGGALRFPEQAVANREVARQLDAWQGPGQPLRGAVTDTSPAVSDGADDAMPSGSVPTDSAPLRLLPPEPTAAASDAETKAASAADNPITRESLAGLEAQLDRMEASNERLSADNRALRSTLLNLQADMARLETLLTRDPISPTPASGRDGDVEPAEITGAMVLEWLRQKFDWAIANPRAAVQEPWVRGWLGGLAGLISLIVLIAWRRRYRRRAARRDDATLPSDWRPQSGRPVVEEPTVEPALGETSVRGTGAQPEPAEPLERASELIAYGRLEQAQAVLDDALGEEPDSIELRLKLLDVLAMREDRAGFESEAHVLQAQINDDGDERWQDVARKGRILSPEHPLFRA